MQYFQYEATDSAGKPAKGTVQGNSEQEVRILLGQNGLTVHRIGTNLAAAPTVPTPIIQPKIPGNQNPKKFTAPVARRAAEAKGSQIQIPVGASVSTNVASLRINIPTAAPLQIKHTRAGFDKDRFFIFAQLAAAARAGMNPAQAFSDISGRSRAVFKESLMELSNAAVEGGQLANVMRQWPDLYPQHVVGMMEAAQAAGFIADAFEEISRQAERAHKFKRWFWWLWFVAINAILSIPGMIWATRALLRSWELIDQTGGSGGFPDALRLTGLAYWELLKWPVGPAFLLMCLIFWLSRQYLSSRFATQFRHELGLRWPVFGPRARQESLSRFAWAMGKVSRAGIPPARAWSLAAETVPNLAMRDRLLSVGTRLSGTEKMSDLVHKSGAFPDEYAPMIATAEYTGDLPGTMERLAGISYNEFEVAENMSKARGGCWGALGCFVTSALMLGILMYCWYYELPAKILKGFE